MVIIVITEIVCIELGDEFCGCIVFVVEIRVRKILIIKFNLFIVIVSYDIL